MSAHEAGRSLELVANHLHLLGFRPSDGCAYLGDACLRVGDEVVNNISKHLNVVTHDPAQAFQVDARLHSNLPRRVGLLKRR
jgi:hypothetical protein